MNLKNVKKRISFERYNENKNRTETESNNQRVVEMSPEEKKMFVIVSFRFVWNSISSSLVDRIWGIWPHIAQRSS